MGASNNAAQQNQAAQQQIGQNTQQAIAAIQGWLGGHPFPVSGANAPNRPPQFGGALPGNIFGGQSGGPTGTIGGTGGVPTQPGGFSGLPSPGGTRIPNPSVGAPPHPQGPQAPGMGGGMGGGEGGGNRHIIEILKAQGLL